MAGEGDVISKDKETTVYRLEIDNSFERYSFLFRRKYLVTYSIEEKTGNVEILAVK